MWSAPTNLRRVEIWTCKLFSSTTTPGQTWSEKLRFGDQVSRTLRQHPQNVKCPRAERQHLAAGKQLALVRPEDKAGKDQIVVHSNWIKVWNLSLRTFKVFKDQIKDFQPGVAAH